MLLKDLNVYTKGRIFFIVPISVDLIKTETKLITNFTTKVNQKKAIRDQNKCVQTQCEKIKLNKSRLSTQFCISLKIWCESMAGPALSEEKPV